MNHTKSWQGYGPTKPLSAKGSIYWYNHFAKLFGSIHYLKNILTLQPSKSIFLVDMCAYVHEETYKTIYSSII